MFLYFSNFKYEEKLEFPAVSVCPGYQFRASILGKFEMDRYGCKNNGEKYCSWDFPWNMATHTETIVKSVRCCTFFFKKALRVATVMVMIMPIIPTNV